MVVWPLKAPDKEDETMKSAAKRRKWQLAFTLTEMMTVAAIVASIPAGHYAKAKQKAHQINCVSNLQQIGKAIVMYQMGEGKYPDAVFFPDDPFGDEKSIVKILADSGAGIPKEMWVCPSAPDAIKEKGLTFVYNDNFAGRRSLKKPSKAWLMIEVNCVSKKVPAPHSNGYNILFADGHVITSRRLPGSVTEKQQAAVEKLRHELHGGRLASCWECSGKQHALNWSSVPKPKNVGDLTSARL